MGRPSPPARHEHDRVVHFQEAHLLAHFDGEIEPLVVLLAEVLAGGLVVHNREAAAPQVHLPGHARVTCHHHDRATRPEARNHFRRSVGETKRLSVVQHKGPFTHAIFHAISVRFCVQNLPQPTPHGFLVA